MRKYCEDINNFQKDGKMTKRAKIIVMVLGFLAVCGSVSAQWTEPVSVMELNTTAHEKAPFLSFDGLSLYFSKQDGPGWHYTRIYRANTSRAFWTVYSDGGNKQSEL